MASDILIVDDEEDIRELVAGILGDEGHETRTAHDADSALAAIADRVPRLVFLDIWMQGSRLDGLALLDEIKKLHPDLAGGDDLRPRQHRNCRFGDPARSV
jgi:two-component system nitrogen regulation response regulator NtrX